MHELHALPGGKDAEAEPEQIAQEKPQVTDPCGHHDVEMRGYAEMTILTCRKN